MPKMTKNLNLLIFFLANFHVKNRIWRKSFFSKLLNWYSNLHATNITKMYSTSIKIVTSYKAINLPYENNVSSLVSLVILFHSLSLCSWFLPLFILNSTSAWWKMNANWRSWKNTTKNLKSSVVGNFFFPFFPRWSQEGSYTSVLWLIDLYPIVFTASFPLFPDSGKPQSLDLQGLYINSPNRPTGISYNLALRISCWIKQFFPVDSWSDS